VGQYSLPSRYLYNQITGERGVGTNLVCYWHTVTNTLDEWVQEERKRYAEVRQPPAAQESPSPHRPNAALAATIRGWAGRISLTADLGL
jgi:hypothetical protein